MSWYHVLKTFKNHSVFVVGEKGTGKDLLFGNVVYRRKKPYISNTSYGKGYNRLVVENLRVGGNRYTDFINDTVKPFVYPYDDGMDIYISDVGVYFPSQYCNELNRDYKELPIFMCLSRQIAEARVHANTQAYGRCWDKIREQFGRFIYCEWVCKPLLKVGFYFASVIIYDREESLKQKVKPFKLKIPLLANKEMHLMADIQRQQFENAHGSVKRHIIFTINHSKHDTRVFKTLLERGVASE